jgi:hypothetical protein
LKVDGTNTFLRFELLAKKLARARGVSMSRDKKIGFEEVSLLKWFVQRVSATLVISLFVYDETCLPSL